MQLPNDQNAYHGENDNENAPSTSHSVTSECTSDDEIDFDIDGRSVRRNFWRGQNICFSRSPDDEHSAQNCGEISCVDLFFRRSIMAVV